MSEMYLTTAEWNTVAGALVEWNAKLQMDRRTAERNVRDLMLEVDALRAERDELAEQAADLGAALEAIKKERVEIEAKLDKTIAENVELVKRAARKAPAKRGEAE